jgi:hypothetical protein
MSLTLIASSGKRPSRDFLDTYAFVPVDVFSVDHLGGGCRSAGALAGGAYAPIFEINRRLDGIGIPYELNEPFLEDLMGQLNRTDLQESFFYALTLARLLEATLLCAGHYADNCEFSLAGDLLVNPRKIKVRMKNDAPAFDKIRHGRLTDQLVQLAELCPGGCGDAMMDKRNATCDIVAPALLPCLHSQLVGTGRFGGVYLERVDARMTAVADTLGFLAAGQILSSTELYLRLQAADPEERAFIERHLCRFDGTWFRLFGMMRVLV